MLRALGIGQKRRRGRGAQEKELVQKLSSAPLLPRSPAPIIPNPGDEL
ncbi:hypothetical protein NSTC745_06548 [Nostoc sp. DSM 114161]|jgi:hypothetical protein